MRIGFDTFGGWEAASSRLRAWKLAERLQRLGHSVAVNGQIGTDVHVFQKVRPPARLREARSSGALVVADFDDHHLLEEVGTRVDVLKFLNHADLVTVGSPVLVDAAHAFHDTVALLENPLDVDEASPPRAGGGWEGRLCWFGNPANLGALEALQLPGDVTTITARGDIEWKLDTIDRDLVQFDLALIPTADDSWSEAKNANRLLKCVALGLPFLASRTSEHLRVAGLLEIPDELLVGQGDNWEARIAHVAAEYANVLDSLWGARERAYSAYGLEAVTRRWLDIVDRAREGSRTNAIPELRAADAFADVDAVVLSEERPEHALTTLHSLCMDDVRWRSVSLVSALPLDLDTAVPSEVTVFDDHPDFFSTYATLSKRFSASNGANTLFLRAGARLTKGFFTAASSDERRRAVWVIPTQLADYSLRMRNHLPERLDELLLEPYVPEAFMCPTELLRLVGPPDALLANFSLWELLIRLVAGYPERAFAEELPLALSAPEVGGRTLLDAFARHFSTLRPALSADLPHRRAEWLRLRRELFAQVVERHRDLYCSYLESIIPSLDALRESAASPPARRPARTTPVDLRLIRTRAEHIARSRTWRYGRRAHRLIRKLTLRSPAPDPAQVLLEAVRAGRSGQASPGRARRADTAAPSRR